MNEKWTVKEVIDYFGEYFEDENNAKSFMGVVEIRLRGKRKIDYRVRMNAMRDLLKEFGYDVPFALQYRRIK